MLQQTENSEGKTIMIEGQKTSTSCKNGSDFLKGVSGRKCEY